MFRVKEVVSEASKVLRSPSLHLLMMSEAVTRRSIVIVTSDGGGLLFLSWRSSTCRERVTRVEKVFIGRD